MGIRLARKCIIGKYCPVAWALFWKFKSESQRSRSAGRIRFPWIPSYFQAEFNSQIVNETTLRLAPWE
jgi:hypothetical protein